MYIVLCVIQAMRYNGQQHINKLTHIVDTQDQHTEQTHHLNDELHNLEAYMEEFTSFLPLAVCILNTKQIIVDGNQALADLVGYEIKELIGNVFNNYIEESDQLTKLFTAVGQVANSTKESQLTLQTKEGGDKPVRITIGPRRDVDGDLTGYFVGLLPTVSAAPPPAPDGGRKVPVQGSAAEDDTDLPDDYCEGTPEYENHKHMAVIDGMRDGMIVIDESGRIDEINSHAAEVLSVDRQDIQGTLLADLKDREDLGVLLEQIEANPEDPEGIKIGSQTYEISVELAEAENRQTYKLVMLHDITKDEFIEDMKLTFVTVAAHQIRTPLSSIRWSLEILIQQLDNDEHKKIAQRGYRSTQNMLEIVNALLNLDRLQSGEDGYNLQPVDITEMIDRYVQQVQDNNHIIDQADVIYNSPVDPLPKVRADEEKLQIVIRNLIDNALKYTPADGSVKVDTSVHVTNDYGSDMVQVEIADNGIGIPDADQDKIFSKFYRADNATKVKTDGTGIGLYISKQIIEAHDGTIWFESEEGEGTTFYIQLPIAAIQD